VIGRLISFSIRCKWTEADVKILAEKISLSVKKAIAGVTA
jgi:hypothetical protein